MSLSRVIAPFARSGHVLDWLARLMALALIFWTVWTSGRALRSQIRFGKPPSHVQPFNRLYDRYDRLRNQLPNGQAIGYASPFRPGDDEFSWRQYIGRYALAPVILDNNDQHAIVIADFNDDVALSAYVRSSRGRLLAHPDIGLGIVERPESSR